MRLHRLGIRALPGIEPGFDFEPASDRVNIVTGPNAIGKSSLVRALKYLLADEVLRNDPPDLHLEAEFLSGDVRWTVRRTGRQIAWRRDGEPAAPPALPGAGRLGLYRLSVESLLADDAGDRELAAALWRMLRGGFDLDRARRPVGPRFGAAEARNLNEKVRALRTVEGAYTDLQQEEAELPDLERRIARSEQAEVRGRRLQTALNLHEAIARRQACADDLEGYSAHMAQLRGDELDDLKALEERIAELREQRSTAKRKMESAGRALENTGLRDARPDPEKLAGIDELLRQTELEYNNLERADKELVEAEADLEDARAQLGGNGGAAESEKAEAAPEDPAKQLAGNAGTARLKPDSLKRAREILEPLVDAQFRRRELQQRLKLAGAPPDASELGQYRDGVDALRAWLAACAATASSPGAAQIWFVTRVFWWATLTLSVLFAAMAFMADAWAVLGTSVFAIAILVFFSWLGRRAAAQAEAPVQDAKRRFVESGLEPPPEWSERQVREHLRQSVQRRFDELRLQAKQAEGVERIRREIEEEDSQIADLEASSRALAREIGVDPALTGAPLYRFIDVTSRFDEARSAHARKSAAQNDLRTLIGKSAKRIRDFLDEWRGEEALGLGASANREDVNALRIAFESLKARMAASSDALGVVEAGKLEIESLNDRIGEAETNVAKLFEGAGIKAGACEDPDGASRRASGEAPVPEADPREALVRMIERSSDWRRVRKALDGAETEEKRLRKLLSGEDGLMESVESGSVDELKLQLRETGEQAGERTELIEKHAAINARLQGAHRSHRLEDAARAKDLAAEALRDKRDEALACAATQVLLDEVESAFKAEREPDLLRRARQWFEHVTAHAFTLELRDTDSFVAHDRAQGELRTLKELSSGTRMQLLLALRLAWTEDRERGGESLPLFLDEALTTSDVDRFSAMARTMSRLADAGRQIFYLSARPQEAGLWKQAAGTAPATIDLAAVRFGSALPDHDALRVETPTALPPPNGLAAEEYAVLIHVHPVNPRAAAGGIHLFHLLRDDLGLLHGLLDTWRIGALGQLESLLASNAAQSAISGRQTRRRLRQRCRTARTWIDHWRQGRGMPVDRAVLDESGAVSDVFLDPAADLAKELEGDGNALVLALRDRRVKGFHASKTDELERWLADRGYVDDAATLEPDERRRLTLQRVAPPTPADAEDVNRVVDWMESTVIS
ncbi:MAG: hypothetical protein OXI74_14675 [Rhodospirillaceae bacterium]|nr:hypothetical protein [Rhodospirillaceae bacterium]